MRYVRITLAALTVTLGLGWILNAQTVISGRVRGPAPDLRAGLIAETGLDEKSIDKVLKALGPAVVEQLRAGRQIDFPGVGTLEVVRVTEYKDLVNGRPEIIPARNYIEYVPTEAMLQAANTAGARPARTVDGFNFRVNPNANPGLKVPNTRVPSSRIR